MATTALAIVALAFWLVAAVPPATANIRDGAVDVSPHAAVTVSVWRLGGSVLQARLTEATHDVDGNPGPPRDVPVRLVPADDGSAVDLFAVYRVERADGSVLMGLDRQYQFTITAKSATDNWLGSGTTTRTYSFSTLASPRPRLPGGVVQLDYQKPVELHWNQPIQGFKAETVPALETRTSIDSAHPDVSRVDLVGAKPGTEYVVRITGALSANGEEMAAPSELRVLTAAPPEPLTSKATMEDGYRIVIPWDRAIKGFDYEITPTVQSVANVGVSDPRRSNILLTNPKQGQEYTVKLKGATATTGAPLSGTRELKVATPKPLKLGNFLPEQPQFGVLLDASISITFSEPVRDRAAAEASIKITPSVPGKFDWSAPDVVRFVPKGKLPGATDFTVSVVGGREGVIGAGGGYLDQSAQFTFWTAPEKEIEVNLSQQKLVLWEGGKPIYSTLVSTGVRGAETPTGLFHVDYKMASTRMRGVNPSGSRYDLPNVPWVMSFQGDYTLHGAYWRDAYGYQQSNGCVSMPVSVAKRVYDWTPEGTPVRIHY